MRFTSALILPLASVVSLISAMEAPIPGYDVFIPEWEVKATPDGETLRINGTVEEVVAELEQINPHYRRSIGLDDPTLMARQQEELEKRQMVQFHRQNGICDHFRGADTGQIMAAVQYLNWVTGRPRNGGGPANCGRVSCGYKTAVWFCNDAPQPRELRSFRDISDGVYAIQNVCHKSRKSYSGQAFHVDMWNVIIRWEDC
ncbi:hypothetical protein CkaCkLH20_00639 [Colletotrichum karsti]|uniref:Secreted protein n=1 Tax=Colletotrichum karsti TaxID=1095194 RepID=A0A9P6IER9_9PEZI|nr:uncharacterized protein CkaCkLH20_00639 [Colletotrichum karsti]KAF9881493.1 hypothetical protein CkaCkLH20_00639 [Colletotrichum karsti]